MARPREKPRSLFLRSRWAIAILVVAMLCHGAANLSLRLALEKANASPVWPPSGIALAAVLLWGYRIWPGILLGAFLANVVAFFANQAASARTIVVVSSAIGIGNTLEAVVAAFLLHRLVGARSPFYRAQDVFKFTAAALLACCVAPSVGPTSISLAGIAPSPVYGTIWFTWWLGDTTGILLVTPLLHVTKIVPYTGGGAMPAREMLVGPTLGATQHARSAAAVNLNTSCARYNGVRAPTNRGSRNAATTASKVFPMPSAEETTTIVRASAA